MAHCDIVPMAHCQKCYMRYNACQQRETHSSTAVPLSAMTDVTSRFEAADIRLVGSVGGDASATGWCVMDHRLREVMFIPMPPLLRDILRNVKNVPDADVRREFMIAIAEFLVLPFAQIQWGEKWQQYGIILLRFLSDNTNTVSLVNKGFAGCEVAQDISRFVSAMEIVLTISTWSAYVDTTSNVMSDDGSRFWDEHGKELMANREHFEKINAQLDEPYRTVIPKEGINQMIEWFATISSPFSLSEQFDITVDTMLKQVLSIGGSKQLKVGGVQRMGLNEGYASCAIKFNIRDKR